MAEESFANEMLLEPPINFTDPVVRFSPDLEKAKIAVQYKSEKEDSNIEQESTKIDGYDVPLVLINQQVLGDQHINSFVLDYKGFTPTLELIIDDPQDDIQYIGGPGLNNIVIAVLCPNVDGIYKSISVPFYIKERVNTELDQIKYVCEYYNLGLMDIKTMQIGDEPLTTFEFCKKVAKMLQFGFAATDQCENINDKRWRQSYSQRYGDFVQQQIGLGGLDSNSIFDAWIDVYGYLVLENVSWVFSVDVKTSNLAIVVQPNVEIPVKDIKENKIFEVPRALFDAENFSIANLRISNKYNNLDTSTTTNEGTDTSFWCMLSSGDNNVLEMQDIQMEENSLDGKDNSNYKFRKSTFIGCDMDEDLPYLMQEQIRKRFLEKKKAKQLIVEMCRPNYGLERGTLVTVGVVETDPKKMMAITQNADNIFNETRAPGKPYNIRASADPIGNNEATDGNLGVINPSLSGMYYIDGMRWVYNKDIKKVVQVLYLLKKSDDTILFNHKASPSITPEQNEVIDIAHANPYET